MRHQQPQPWNRGWFTAALAVIVLCMTGPVMAQATRGQISGKVLDADGQPLPGVTVVANSAALQGERALISDQSGRFNFPQLPPGFYSLEFRLETFQILKVDAIKVVLGGIVPVEATMRKGEVRETVVVTADYPLIQPKTADVSMNISGDQLDSIPTAARSFVDLARFVPSITGTELNTTDPTSSAAPAPSIRGEGQYGDNYLIDGLSVRDPSVKTSGAPLNFDALEEVQIITDGFSPEYGQSLGGAINAVTKSGSNTFAGELAYLYRGDSTTSDFEPVLLGTPSGFERTDPYINLGGPIVKDKLWYFGSYNRSEDTDEFAPTTIAGFGLLAAGTQETESDLAFGKLSYAPTANHNIAANYTWRDQMTTGFDANIATPEARREQEVGDRRWRLNYQAVLGVNSILEFKYGNLDRKIDTIPPGGLGPAQYEITSFPVLTNNAWRASKDERTRDDYSLIFTQFWNPGTAGTHEFKIGVDYRELEQISRDDFSGTAEDVFGIGVVMGQPDFGLADGFNGGTKFQFTEMGGIIVPTTLNEYRSGGALSNRNEEWGGFIQDRWEIGNWNILAGVRFDQQKGFNDTGGVFFEYDAKDALAPRISVTWDVSGDGKNVLKSGWGSFYDTTSLRLGEFANSRESFAFRTYDWQGMTDQDFRANIGMGNAYDIRLPANWTFINEQSNASNPLDYSLLRQPANVEKFLLEYDRQVANDYVFKARFVDSATRGMVEDIHYFYNNWAVVNTDLKRRDYQAIEFEFNGNPTPNISFNAAYVHSDADGTNPGQFETAGFLGDSGSGNNIGVFLDRPPSNPQGWCDIYGPACVPASYVNIPRRDYDNDDDVDQFDRDLLIQTLFAGLGGIDSDDGWYGPLVYDVSDQVKINGRVVFPKAGNMYINGFIQWSSGYHNERNGFQGIYGDFLTFSDNLAGFNAVGAGCNTAGAFGTCQNDPVVTPVAGTTFNQESGLRRGSMETASFWTLDLSVGKLFTFSRGLGVEVRLEMFNLFDNQDVIAYQDRATDTFMSALARQRPRSARLFARFSWGG